MTNKNSKVEFSSSDGSSVSPGKLRLIEALKYLLERKDFNSITTAEIAKTAQTNEALIYWHFKDKRDLLHQVLEEYLREHTALIASELKKIKGAIAKLKKVIALGFHIWNKNRIYAKILLIEVRSYAGYFESQSHMIVRNYANTVKEIIEEGISNGEIRNDISPNIIRDIILGGIEHHILSAIIFNKIIFPEERSDHLCKIIIGGILIQNEKGK